MKPVQPGSKLFSLLPISLHAMYEGLFFDFEIEDIDDGSVLCQWYLPLNRNLVTLSCLGSMAHFVVVPAHTTN